MKKILIVADEPGWVFERHAWEIRKRLPEFTIDIAFRNQHIPQMAQDYDLVYVMDPIPLRHGYPPQEKILLGLRCEFLYEEHPDGAKGLYQHGFPGRCASISDRCKALHVVNRNQVEVMKDVVTDKPLYLAQHGIDESLFCKEFDRDYDYRKIRVGTAGRASRIKGFNLIQQACAMADAEFCAAIYGATKISKEGMPNYYGSLDVYVCMSTSEGLNNGTMEAGATGLPVVSTRVGAAPEMIRHGENGFLVDRDVENLSDALIELRDGALRKKFGEEMKEEISANWTWEKRIEDFRKMFNELT